MPKVNYNIKTTADVKAVKQTEKAIKDVGQEAEKTTRKLKDQTRATKDMDRSLKDAAKSGDNFAQKIGKQVFGSLISFALVERSVNALKTIFAPAMRETADAAADAGTAIGNFLAAQDKLRPATEAFRTAADSLNTFAEAIAKVEINLDKTLPKLADPRLKTFASEEGKIFAAQLGAQQAADERTLSEFDAETQRQLTGAGSDKNRIRRITAARAKERGGLLESFQQRDIESLRSFFGELPNIKNLSPAVTELREAMKELERATKNLAVAQGEAITAEKDVLRASTTGLATGVLGTELRPTRSKAEPIARQKRAAAESALQARNAAFRRVQQLRGAALGITSTEELNALGAQINEQQNIAAGAVSARGNVLSNQQSITQAQAQSQDQIIAAQIAAENATKDAKRLTDAINTLNKLLQNGFPETSRTIEVLRQEIRQLKENQKESRNTGGL